MIKKEHLEDFMFRMRMLGLDRYFPKDFEKKCDDVIDLLQVKVKVPYPKEILHFVMRVKYSMLEGFTPLGVHTKLYNFGDIAHLSNESIDSKKIEAELIRVSLGEISYRRVKDDVENLKKMSSQGAIVAEQLIAKHILGTDEEKNVPQIGDIRIKYTRAYSFDMGDNVTEYSLTEMRSLLLGRPVYKMQPDLHQGAWMQLEMQPDGDCKMRQMAQHYNYDVKQVFRQLPHAILLDEKELELIDYQFKNGMRLRLFLYDNSQITKVEAIADPLNRSLILFEEGTKNTIPMSRYVAHMKPPIEIDYYKVYINNRFVINSNSYADVSRWAIKQTDPVRVVGMLPGKIPVFDSRGNLKEGTGLLIMSKNIKKYFPYLSEHICSGDVCTAYERELRKTFLNYPYLKETDYERAFAAIQKANAANKSLSAECALRAVQEQGINKTQRHEQKFRHHL